MKNQYIYAEDAFLFDHKNRRAPVLDVFVGLIEPPFYVLYLGLVDQAESRLLGWEGVKTIMRQKDFVYQGLQRKYFKRAGILDDTPMLEDRK